MTDKTSQTGPNNGPLNGIRVIEFTGLGPAPLAGQLLADMGADVIVIDRKSVRSDLTDVNRRGKRSIALNLKAPEGRAAVMRLLEGADVLIEGFRPGVMEKLGLGPQDVPAHLIYGRMTGWGQTGPLAATAGHDLTYLALTGTLNQFGRPGVPPHSALNYVADFGGGTMFLIFGVLSAIIERQRSGQGQVVDAAMVDGVAAMGGLIHTLLAKGLAGETRGQNFLDGSAPYYRSYECACGGYVAVGCIEPQFFAAFLALAGLPSEDAKHQQNPEHWPDMHSRFEAQLMTKTRDEWAAIFEQTDACVAPVLTLSEALANPHMAARGVYQKIDKTIHAAPAPRFSRSTPRAPQNPGAPGADAREVLKEAGLSDDEIDQLENTNVIT